MMWIRRALLLTLTLSATAAMGFDVTAKSALILDAETGKVLWSKNGDAHMFPASTTKIMTGLLLVERCLPTDILSAPKDILTVGESSMHLQPGEKVCAKDMLYALMLRSANDGAYAVAVNLGGNIPNFAKMMNDRAAAIGCTNTHFTNPNGLHDPNHYTSAHDLALIAREAMKYQAFRDAVKTTKYKITRSINKQDLSMVSRNKWLKKDLTADGIKTGYTVPAGHTYVGSATRDGYRIITVVMKSEHWQLDHQEMLNWAFKYHEHTVVQQKGSQVSTAAVSGGKAKEVTLVCGEQVLDMVPKGTQAKVQWTFDVPKDVPAPIKAGQSVGSATVTDDTGWSVKVPLLAGEDVEKASPLAIAGSSPLSFGMLTGTLCFGAYFMRSKARRRMKFYGKAPARTRFL